jgi:hypothetical protein
MRITLALALFSTVLMTQAQLELRPHAGINIQNLTESPEGTEWKGSTGYQFGVHVMLGNQLFFQPGLQYVTSKSELSFRSGAGSQNSTATLTTGAIRLPVVVGYRFTDPGTEPMLNFRLFAGMVGNFPLSSSFNEDGVEDVDAGPAQFALSAGAGLDISLFFIEAGYDIGMSNVFDDEDFKVDTKQNQFQISVGVRLKFAK